MKHEETDDLYDISDYHRLKCLGDNVNDILLVILKNIAVGVGLFEVGEQVHSVYLNEAYFTCVGYTKEQYKDSYHNIFSTLLPEDAIRFKACIEEHAPKGEDIQCTFRGYRADGSLNWFEVHGVALENKNSIHPLYLTVVKNITEKKEYENSLEALKNANAKLMMQEERYKILEATARGLLFEYYPDSDTMIFSYNFPDNKKRREINHYSEFIKNSPLVHSSHLQMFKDALWGACKKETEGNLEYLSLVSGGGYRWHNTHYKSVADEDGKILSVMGRIEDIHEEKIEKNSLNIRAERDGLTNLYRKETVFEKIEEYLCENPKGQFFFIVIDLDDFKNINDRYGHQYGDEVLKKVAKDITGLFGETGILGRFGGDEFVILTRDMSKYEVERQLNKLKETNRFCAGVAQCYPGECIKDIFYRADRGMYQVKGANKNGILFCD
ncbi:MAG: diguanylate cyclase [Acetatifactor sp.]